MEIWIWISSSFAQYNKVLICLFMKLHEKLKMMDLYALSHDTWNTIRRHIPLSAKRHPKSFNMWHKMWIWRWWKDKRTFIMTKSRVEKSLEFQFIICLIFINREILKKAQIWVGSWCKQMLGNLKIIFCTFFTLITVSSERRWNFIINHSLSFCFSFIILALAYAKMRGKLLRVKLFGCQSIFFFYFQYTKQSLGGQRGN